MTLHKLLEPTHMMYLNSGNDGGYDSAKKLEPTHMMYLNLAKRKVTMLSAKLEPTHMMYLNSVKTCSPVFVINLNRHI